jgi:hypothetical protein
MERFAVLAVSMAVGFLQVVGEWRRTWQWVFHGRVAERKRNVWLREENK